MLWKRWTRALAAASGLALTLPGSGAAAQAVDSESIRAALSQAESSSGQAQQQVDRLLRTFRYSRALFGNEHVLLTAIAYSGQLCSFDKHTVFHCQAKQTRSGLAGAVMVPLLGGGKGYGWADWWPRIETSTEAEAILDFQHAIERMQTTLMAFGVLKSTDPSMRPVRLSRLMSAARALEQLLVYAAVPFGDSEGSFKDADAWPLFMLRCLQDLMLRMQAPGFADPPPPVAADQPPPLEASSSVAEEAEPEPRALPPEPVRNDRLDDAAAELDALWHEYRRLAHQKGSRTRHNYLIGPAVGFPMTNVDEWLYGLGIEVGAPALRATLIGGFRSTYTNRWVVGPVGWFLGIGISGEFADDLFHLANGGLKAARTLSGESVSLLNQSGAP